MPAVSRPVVFFQGKGEKSMRVKCISCGQELNLDHWVFEDYSGPGLLSKEVRASFAICKLTVFAATA